MLFRGHGGGEDGGEHQALNSDCPGDSFHLSFSEVQAWEANMVTHLLSRSETEQPAEEEGESSEAVNISTEEEELLEMGWMKPTRMSSCGLDELGEAARITCGQQAVDGIVSVVYDEEYSQQHAMTNVRTERLEWGRLQMLHVCHRQDGD